MAGWKTTHTVALALAGALGVSVGINLQGWGDDSGKGVRLPTIPVQASTAQNYDNFAVATGPVDDDVEAFYFLDFLTGELKATAINTRKGQFGSFYQYNITQDFQTAGSKNPKYLMVTGVARIPRGKGNSQIASSVVYVTEATTGQMAAYVMPWNSSAQASGKPQMGTFLKIADVKLRDTFVRDQ